jgi:outer membrane protein assembly factor BamB
LTFDYLLTTIAQNIKLNVYGKMWGFDTLLYSGDTTITALSGIDGNYSVALKWMGPSSPPPGQASMQVVIGPIGTITINGNLTLGWPMINYDAQHSGRCLYIGPQDTTLSWSYPIGSVVNSSPAVDKNGAIYVGAQDQKLYAFNPDGSLKWTFSTGGEVYSSPAIGNDGTVYIGSLDHNIYAVNPNGSLKWTYSTGGAVYSSPTISSDGTIYIGSYDAKLYAINPDGTLKGSFAARGRIVCSPCIASNGIIYVASCEESRLYAVNPDFSLLWQTEGLTNVIVSSPSLSPGEKAVYFGAQDGFFYARNTSDGSLKWKQYAYGGFNGTAAIGTDGIVYIGSEYGNLWALNPEDGTKKWDYYMTLPVDASPAIGADGTIYFASAYGGLFAMNPDGTLKWSLTNPDAYGNIYSSPAIGGDGKLYVGCNGGKLLAFGKN